MFKLESLSTKNKKEYDRLIESYIANGDDKTLATYKTLQKMKSEDKITEKTFKTFSQLMEEGESIDVNQDGVIDNEDIKLGLDELELTTRLEEDLVEFLQASAEHDLIPLDMVDGIFELIGDHVDLSDMEDESDDVQEDIEIEGCELEEVRAKALIRKKGGKRRVRCTSGPNKGRIRVAGQCGKKVNLKLSRKLKRSKKRISGAKKSLAARRGQRTAKRRGTK